MSQALGAKVWVGQEGLATASGGVHEHHNPATGAWQASVPLAGRAEVEKAVAKAQSAFQEWRWMNPSQRRQILLKFADLIEARTEEFARLTTLDGGSPLHFGGYAVQLAAEWFRYYAGLADKLTGEVLGTIKNRGEFSYTVPEPIGVVGIIITWNGPLISLGMKVAPALAAGNCVVVKPAEITPFAPDLFARLAAEAGIPDGVLSLFPGNAEAGQALCEDKRVRLISFTGGPVTARKIMATCAEQIKPTIMELGGKSASLVFPDADLDRACEEAVRGSIGILSGQGCAIPTRLLVHDDIYDEVLARIVAIAREYKVGNPLEEGVQVGPVISAAACDRITAMLDRVRNEDAGRILLGGKRCGGELANGYFIEPTIIADVDPWSEISQLEIFGPVLCVMKFTTEEEAVAIANNTEYGLSAYIQSRDVSRVHRLAEQLHAGGVYVNGAFQIHAHTPFGGVGISGFGKEGGRAGLDEYLHYKTVGILG
ncbi:aldehyde dehydrogenase family protein [Haliea salexigens]|uniref:aldehyde dehydrogenase family protein n=1 Tax=Haliea salexigens TaxID=287487 RepID=UPI00040E122E|nr:aldehyde dehydrogenase family protein [Haliea salexigens]